MPRQQRHRRGFTVRELLVIVFVLALMFGLLLPAVRATRASATWTQCLHNQRQISIALIRFEHDHKHYPGWAVNQNPDENGCGGREASWVFAVLPYLDRADIYNFYGQDHTLGAAAIPPQEELKVLTCPDTFRSSDPNHFPAGTMALSYVVNTGYYHDALPYRDRPEHPAVGLFTYQYRSAPDEVRTRLGSKDVTDGLASTLMLSENVDAGTWIGRPKTGDTTNSVEEGCVGFSWMGNEPIPLLNRHAGVESDCSARKLGPSGALPRPSSWHSGGVIVAFCDGHTQFLSEDINLEVFELLCTPQQAIVDIAYRSIEPQRRLGESE